MRSAKRRAAGALALTLALSLSFGPAAGALTPIPGSIELHPPTPPGDYRVPPSVSAQSWILFDATDGIVLASHLADDARPMASTTKMMSALVALENGDLDEIVEISPAAAAVGEAEIGLVAGERLRLGDLVTTMLVRSANDAAVAVAEAVGGDVDTFVAMMNARGAEIGLTSTHFVNPHGLDAAGHYSTARDLLRIAVTAMQNPVFREMVGTTRFMIQPAPDGTVRVAEATNRLLGEYEGLIGVKTGFTFQAGLVFVAAAEREGTTMYAVVMGSEGSQAHFSDAASLLDFGFAGNGLVRAVSGEPMSDGSRLARLAGLEAAIHVASLMTGSVEGLEVGGSMTPVALEDSKPLPSLADAWLWVLERIDG